MKRVVLMQACMLTTNKLYKRFNTTGFSADAELAARVLAINVSGLLTAHKLTDKHKVIHKNCG